MDRSEGGYYRKILTPRTWVGSSQGGLCLVGFVERSLLWYGLHSLEGHSVNLERREAQLIGLAERLLRSDRSVRAVQGDQLCSHSTRFACSWPTAITLQRRMAPSKRSASRASGREGWGKGVQRETGEAPSSAEARFGAGLPCRVSPLADGGIAAGEDRTNQPGGLRDNAA